LYELLKDFDEKGGKTKLQKVVNNIFDNGYLDEENLISDAIDLLSPLNFVLADNKTLRKQLNTFEYTDFRELSADYLEGGLTDQMEGLDDEDFEYIVEKVVGNLEEYLKETLANNILNRIEKLLEDTREGMCKRV
jgi:hypothetical protein